MTTKARVGPSPCKTVRSGGLVLRVCDRDEQISVSTPTDDGAAMIDLYRSSFPRLGKQRLVVKLIDIPLAARGARLGTKLYEYALKLACKEDRLLASDTMRSSFAEAFWRKQEAKGRATCLQDEIGGQYYRSPLVELRDARDTGEISTRQFLEITKNLPKPLPAIDTDSDPRSPRWPCAQYVVKGPCATRTLARLPRRRRR